MTAGNSEITFLEISGLQPCGRRSAPVAAVGALRDDALKPHLVDGAKDRQPIAVENGGPAWQLDCQRDGPVFCRPVMAVLIEKTHAALIDDELRPVAVELDLVNPSLIFGRLLGHGRDLRRNELQPAAADLATL